MILKSTPNAKYDLLDSAVILGLNKGGWFRVKTYCPCQNKAHRLTLVRLIGEVASDLNFYPQEPDKASPPALPAELFIF